ncbi:MAG TPA: DUF92 domain-containing protein [Gemmatimonadales bacterium]|jgi:uncharacterized protein (TIGR00297 family)|nr:DUF92 domain-containing protein [Gemmatimonadales bacterium]
MSPAPALGIALAAALLAWFARAVTAGGAIAATAVGATLLWATGWPGGLVLAAFFLPSTLIGRLAGRRPSASDARGERRDQVQVLANGAAAAAFACAERSAPGLGLWMLTGALATASADTWATSVGALSPRDPRALLSGDRVPRGTSGGVSISGTAGGIAGALLVAGVAALAGRDRLLFVVGALLGTAGMLLDSLLGASIQARFRCPVCNTPSERRRHRCDTRTELVGGCRWLDNDGVNAVATLAGGLAAAVAWTLR